VKSGFALCTNSLEDLIVLEKSIVLISQLIGDCIIERQTKWTTYCLDNIPKTVNTYDGSCIVNVGYLTTTILNAIGQTLTQTIETSQSI
jgi:hypothetical protein